MTGGFLRRSIATSTTVRIIHTSLFSFFYYLTIGLLLAVLPGFVHLHLGLSPLWAGVAVDRWHDLSVDRILAQTDEQTKIVPGHGPVATRADLQAYRDMLVQVRQRIKALITAGKTMDEVVAAAPTKDFDAKWGSGYVTPDVFTKIVFSSLMKRSASQ